MRYLRLAMVPLLLAACDQQPVAPEIDAPPALRATHESFVLEIPVTPWYTAMDCLGYDSWEPPDAVYWTASWLKISVNLLYLPNGELAKDREFAEWSDDLRFETPEGEVWESVDNIYVGVINATPSTYRLTELLVFENPATGARLKLTDTANLTVNAHGDVMVDRATWSCKLTRPGK